MDEHHQWLNLLVVPKLGPVTINKLYQAGLMPQVFSQSASVLTPLRFNAAQQQALLRPDSLFIDRVELWCCEQGGWFVTLADENYPALLREIADPPPILFGLGDASLLHAPQLAMIGSRHASPAGCALARRFAREITEVGYLVNSGLALGIDASAHKGALERGVTTAVLGSGLAEVYPKRHQSLAQQIIDSGGLLLSELPPWTKPKGFQFPRRNRIISGLSEGVLVVEASERSGSLITARLAAEQGREVYATPGAVGNPNSRGCHRLIKEGAALVEELSDIFPDVGLKQKSQAPHCSTDKGSRTLPNSLLLDNVRDSATSVDELVEQTGLAVDKVLSELLTLEVQGRVAAVPGGYIRLRES